MDNLENKKLLYNLEDITGQNFDTEKATLFYGSIFVNDIDYFNSLMMSLGVKKLFYHPKCNKIWSMEEIGDSYVDIHMDGNKLISSFLDKYSKDYIISKAGL